MWLYIVILLFIIPVKVGGSGWSVLSLAINVTKCYIIGGLLGIKPVYIPLKVFGKSVG